MSERDIRGNRSAREWGPKQWTDAVEAAAEKAQAAARAAAEKAKKTKPAKKSR